MTGRDVQRVYSLVGARWYDPFRALWVLCTSRRAERDLDALFRRYVTPQARILDLACGTGVNVGRLVRLGLPFASYEGVDLTDRMLAIAKKKFGHLPGVTFSQGDVTALKDTGAPYDVVVSTYLLSHLREPAAFVNSVQRFLEPHGRLLLIFYSRPRWFLDWWLTPLGRLILRADPVSVEEARSFSGVVSRKAYFAGAVSLIEIAISGEDAQGAARTASGGRDG
jgi:ubiquinone/menaquinone biosynthesis C-methylase UbiE